MHLWLSQSSEVPLREQLEAQIILGIVSSDLKAGQRLPSTREIARRYKIHANTVSAAYRQLARKGWVQFRQGSGVYVRARAVDQSLDGQLELDRLISLFLRTAREKNFSLHEIQSRLRHWLALQAPDHFVIVEPDPELRQILIKEIEEATGKRTIGATLADCADPDVLAGAAAVTMYAQTEKVRAALPQEMELLVLQARSVRESMRGQQPPPRDALIAIVSRWPEFLRWSRTMLIAAGLDADALNVRDARKRGWEQGLRSAAFVITDSLIAELLPAGCTARVFRLISDSSVLELRAYVERFFR